MKYSKPLLALVIVFAAGTSAVSAAAPKRANAATSGDKLVKLCYRARTIQVPFYLKQRYTSNGATVGACVTTSR